LNEGWWAGKLQRCRGQRLATSLVQGVQAPLHLVRGVMSEDKAVKRQALELYLEGHAFRSIGRILWFSKVTILNWMSPSILYIIIYPFFERTTIFVNV
jgi:hypothetical protein